MSMLSLLTCSVSRLEEFDPYAVPRTPLRSRRLSKGLGFVKTAPPPSNSKRRRLSKTTIGVPTDFRHEHHLGKDVIPEKMVSLWDSARWQQELQKESSVLPPTSVVSSVAPSSPSKPNVAKRNSFTPQKRKPVPSLIPDLPAKWSLATAAPQDIPLPPSPTASASKPRSEAAVSERHSEESVVYLLLPDQPRPCPSLDEERVADLSDLCESACPTAGCQDDIDAQ